MIGLLHNVDEPRVGEPLKASWAVQVVRALKAIAARLDLLQLSISQRDVDVQVGVVTACSVSFGVAAAANTITYTVAVTPGPLTFTTVTPINRVVVPSAFPLIPAPQYSPCLIVYRPDVDNVRRPGVIVFGEQITLDTQCPVPT